MRLWLRLGDGDDYRDCGDDLAAVGDVLRGYGIGPVESWRPGGFEAPGHERDNYVSLYWGDEAADLDRVLTFRERSQIMAALN